MTRLNNPKMQLDIPHGFKQLSVQVTQEDIDRALRNVSSSCAVAVALKRSVPDIMRIDVDLQLVRFTLDKKRFGYLTPRSVQEYIGAFDAGNKVEPFTFKMTNPMVTGSRGRARIEVKTGPGGHASFIRKDGEMPRTGRYDHQKGEGRYTKTRVYGARVLRMNEGKKANVSREMPWSPEVSGEKV